MTDEPGIRPIRAAVLFAMMFIFFIVPAEAASKPHQKGSFTAVFEQYSPLSDAESISNRTGVRVEQGSDKKHGYDIEQESFEVYVPDCYDSNTPFGLIVWISASPSGSIERYRDPKQLMAKHKLIWVGANNSGNNVGTYNRRIPLALDAAYNMQKLYNIDPNRVYVAGISGGGRVASITAFHHSDVYDGGIFVIGANYWESMSAPDQNGSWRAGSPRPLPGNLLRAKKFGRYVLLTGDKDGNRLQMHTYYEKGFSKCLDHVLYIQVPGMGHEVPPAEEFDKALEYVDKPLSQKTEKAPRSGNQKTSRERNLNHGSQI
jgi:predicted esterase